MPEITRDVLTDKIATLTAQRERAIGQVNAMAGAIQACQELLAELERPEPDAAEDVTQPAGGA